VGEGFGEKGILQRESRPLTAQAETPLRLISIEAFQFRKLMGVKVRNELEAKLAFVKKHIPHANQLPTAQ
jgi:CRP-like cAMP-binding protein